MLHPIRSLILSFTVSLLLAGCTTTPHVQPTAADYNREGDDLFATKRYEDAIESWKRVKESYSSPEMTALAELKIADAHFANGSYIEAAAAYEAFRKLHPGHERGDYALYQLGLSHFNQMGTIDTDPTPANNATITFTSFLDLYPKSQYVSDVREKLAFLEQRRVQFEIYVGRFYLRSEKFSAAIKRLEESLTAYPGSPLHDETLFYLSQAYFKAGLREKGRDALDRLGRTYPSSRFVPDAASILEKFYQ